MIEIHNRLIDENEIIVATKCFGYDFYNGFSNSREPNKVRLMMRNGKEIEIDFYTEKDINEEQSFKEMNAFYDLVKSKMKDKE